MDEETIICTCMNVSVGDIKRAIEAGANDFKSIQDQTGLATVCGLCLEEAEQVVAQLLEERNV